MAGAGLAGDVPIRLVPGPEEYLLGEEKALLEVIEGKDPLPRLLPPYLHGLFSTAPQMGWIPAPPRGGPRRAPREQPDAGQQRRDPLQRPLDPGPGPGVVPDHGHAVVARHGGGHRGRRRRPAGRHRGRDGHPPLRPAQRPGRRAAARPHLEGGLLRGGQPGDRPVPLRPADDLRGLHRLRHRPRRRRLHRLRRQRLHGQRRPALLPVPGRRVLRPVLALQARLGRDHRPPRAHRARHRLRRRHHHASAPGSARSPTAPAATWPPRSGRS